MSEGTREQQVWTYNAGHARHFFRVGDDAPVRVVKERPETEDEKKYNHPESKLFAVTTPASRSTDEEAQLAVAQANFGDMDNRR